MSDDDIDAMVRDLIDEHLADEFREAAVAWLTKRDIANRAVKELGLLEGQSK
jgi:hypothetical protein